MCSPAMDILRAQGIHPMAAHPTEARAQMRKLAGIFAAKEWSYDAKLEMLKNLVVILSGRNLLLFLTALHRAVSQDIRSESSLEMLGQVDTTVPDTLPLHYRAAMAHELAQAYREAGLQDLEVLCVKGALAVSNVKAAEALQAGSQSGWEFGMVEQYTEFLAGRRAEFPITLDQLTEREIDRLVQYTVQHAAPPLFSAFMESCRGDELFQCLRERMSGQIYAKVGKEELSRQERAMLLLLVQGNIRPSGDEMGRLKKIADQDSDARMVWGRFNLAVADDAGDKEGRKILAQYYSERDDFEHGIPVVERLLEKDMRDSVEVKSLASRLYCARYKANKNPADLKRAKELREEAYSAAYGEYRALERRMKRGGDRRQRGLLLLQQKLVASYASELIVIYIEFDNVDASQFKPLAVCARANNLIKQGRHREAAALLREVMARDEELFFYSDFGGRIERLRDDAASLYLSSVREFDPELARRAGEEMLAQHQQSPVYLDNLGTAFGLEGSHQTTDPTRLRTAQHYFELAIRCNEFFLVAWFNRLCCLRGLQEAQQFSSTLASLEKQIHKAIKAGEIRQFKSDVLYIALFEALRDCTSEQDLVVLQRIRGFLAEKFPAQFAAYYRAKEPSASAN